MNGSSCKPSARLAPVDTVLLGVGGDELLLLLSNSRGPSGSGLLDLASTSLGLVGEELGTVGLCLTFVNKFHQNPLVLEHITLALQV